MFTRAPLTKTGSLKQQNFIVSQFRSLEVYNQGGRNADSFWGPWKQVLLQSCSWLVDDKFFLCLYTIFPLKCVCLCVQISPSLVTQLCPTLFNPMNCSLPGSFVHGILQTRILEWDAIFFSRGSSWPRDRAWVSYIAGRFFTIWATRKLSKNTGHVGLEVKWSEVAQSCLTLCDPMDCSLPGSSVRGIFQARILEWVAATLMTSF